MRLEPWERAFLAALEHGPAAASPVNALIEPGADWPSGSRLKLIMRKSCGPTRNGWGLRTDTRVGSKKLRKAKTMVKNQPDPTPEEIKASDEALNRAGGKEGASVDDRLTDPALDILADWRDDVDGG